MTNQEKINETLSQLFELAMRINIETEMCAFVDLSGHVGQIKITIRNSKEDYLKQLTRHEMYYYTDYGDDNGFADFMEKSNVAITDLNNLLTSGVDKKYTAYCNLIDMSCSQVFTSEAAAQAWVKKMKRKYGEVHAIVGYKEEVVRLSV